MSIAFVSAFTGIASFLFKNGFREDFTKNQWVNINGDNRYYLKQGDGSDLIVSLYKGDNMIISDFSKEGDEHYISASHPFDGYLIAFVVNSKRRKKRF